MPIKVATIDSLPRPTRKKRRALENSDEWLQLRAKLVDGIRPGEAVYITFTPQQRQQMQMKTAGRILLKMAKQHVAKLKLTYEVSRYHSNGEEVVVVANPNGRGKHSE